jgi:copper transporter 1
MDHGHMDHGHMDHGGHMGHDMPGMGGDGPKCNMNVWLPISQYQPLR